MHLEIEDWMENQIDKKLYMKPKMIVAILVLLSETFNQYFYYSARCVSNDNVIKQTQWLFQKM